MAITIDLGISLALFAWLFAYLTANLRSDHPEISLLFLLNSLIISLYSFFAIGEIATVDAVYPDIASSINVVYGTQWFLLFFVLLYFFIQFFKQGLEHLNKDGRPKFGV